LEVTVLSDPVTAMRSAPRTSIVLVGADDRELLDVRDRQLVAGAGDRDLGTHAGERALGRLDLDLGIFVAVDGSRGVALKLAIGNREGGDEDEGKNESVHGIHRDPAPVARRHHPDISAKH